MMLKLQTTKQFRKDYKRIKKRGYNLELLEEVLLLLLEQKTLPLRCHDHRLTGNYDGFRECHIQPDWLLVYKIFKDTLILQLIRTGSHSDLF